MTRTKKRRNDIRTPPKSSNIASRYLAALDYAARGGTNPPAVTTTRGTSSTVESSPLLQSRTKQEATSRITLPYGAAAAAAALKIVSSSPSGQLLTAETSPNTISSNKDEDSSNNDNYRSHSGSLDFDDIRNTTTPSRVVNDNNYDNSSNDVSSSSPESDILIRQPPLPPTQPPARTTTPYFSLPYTTAATTSAVTTMRPSRRRHRPGDYPSQQPTANNQTQPSHSLVDSLRSLFDGSSDTFWPVPECHAVGAVGSLEQQQAAVKSAAAAAAASLNRQVITVNTTRTVDDDEHDDGEGDDDNCIHPKQQQHHKFSSNSTNNRRGPGYYHRGGPNGSSSIIVPVLAPSPWDTKSDNTAASTNVATNRAVDVALKRIRFLDEQGQYRRGGAQAEEKKDSMGRSKDEDEQDGLLFGGGSKQMLSPQAQPQAPKSPAATGEQQQANIRRPASATATSAAAAAAATTTTSTTANTVRWRQAGHRQQRLEAAGLDKLMLRNKHQVVHPARYAFGKPQVHPARMEQMHSLLSVSSAEESSAVSSFERNKHDHIQRQRQRPSSEPPQQRLGAVPLTVEDPATILLRLSRSNTKSQQQRPPQQPKTTTTNNSGQSVNSHRTTTSGRLEHFVEKQQSAPKTITNAVATTPSGLSRSSSMGVEISQNAPTLTAAAAAATTTTIAVHPSSNMALAKNAWKRNQLYKIPTSFGSSHPSDESTTIPKAAATTRRRSDYLIPNRLASLRSNAAAGEDTNNNRGTKVGTAKTIHTKTFSIQRPSRAGGRGGAGGGDLLKVSMDSESSDRCMSPPPIVRSVVSVSTRRTSSPDPIFCSTTALSPPQPPTLLPQSRGASNKPGTALASPTLTATSTMSGNGQDWESLNISDRATISVGDDNTSHSHNHNHHHKGTTTAIGTVTTNNSTSENTGEATEGVHSSLYSVVDNDDDAVNIDDKPLTIAKLRKIDAISSPESIFCFQPSQQAQRQMNDSIRRELFSEKNPTNKIGPPFASLLSPNDDGSTSTNKDGVVQHVQQIITQHGVEIKVVSEQPDRRRRSQQQQQQWQQQQQGHGHSQLLLPRLSSPPASESSPVRSHQHHGEQEEGNLEQFDQADIIRQIMWEPRIHLPLEESRGPLKEPKTALARPCTSKKAGASFLAAVSKFEHARTHYPLSEPNIVLEEEKTAFGKNQPLARSRSSSSLNAHLSQPWKSPMDPTGPGHLMVDVQSIRSAIESIINSPGNTANSAEDDDTASVKSLRERFEAPQKQTVEKENSVRRMRALFEPKAAPASKRFDAAAGPLKEAISKFDFPANRPCVVSTSRSTLGQPKTRTPVPCKEDSQSCKNSDNSKSTETSVVERIRAIGGNSLGHSNTVVSGRSITPRSSMSTRSRKDDPTCGFSRSGQIASPVAVTNLRDTSRMPNGSFQDEKGKQTATMAVSSFRSRASLFRQNSRTQSIRPADMNETTESLSNERELSNSCNTEQQRVKVQREQESSCPRPFLLEPVPVLSGQNKPVEKSDANPHVIKPYEFKRVPSGTTSVSTPRSQIRDRLSQVFVRSDHPSNDNVVETWNKRRTTTPVVPGQGSNARGGGAGCVDHYNSLPKLASASFRGAEKPNELVASSQREQQSRSPSRHGCQSDVDDNDDKSSGSGSDEFSDGVTLDMSIAEVSNLTNPTALISRTGEPSVVTDAGESSDPSAKSVDLNEAEARRSEASSDQTSEAAAPLIAKAMRCRPMSDEMSANSFFAKQALIANHWSKTSGWDNANERKSEIPQSEVPDATKSEQDNVDYWDPSRVQVRFPVTQSSGSGDMFDFDSEWQAFPLLSSGPDAWTGGDPVERTGAISPRSKTPTRSNTSARPSAPQQSLPVSAHTDPILAPSKPVPNDEASTPRSTSVLLGRTHPHRIIDPAWKRRANSLLASGRREPQARMSASSIERLPVRLPPSQHRQQPLRSDGLLDGRHAALMARLRSLKEARLRRMAGIARSTSLTSRGFSYSNVQLPDDDNSNCTFGTGGSSTQFGGNTFMASLMDLD